MNDVAYCLPIFDKLLHHGWRWHQPQTFHDATPSSKQELEAQVASQDYLAMVATQLDQISQHLENNQHSDYLILEKLISDLLYLHARYQIVKK